MKSGQTWNYLQNPHNVVLRAVSHRRSQHEQLPPSAPRSQAWDASLAVCLKSRFSASFTPATGCTLQQHTPEQVALVPNPSFQLSLGLYLNSPSFPLRLFCSSTELESTFSPPPMLGQLWGELFTRQGLFPKVDHPPAQQGNMPVLHDALVHDALSFSYL